MPDEPLKVPLVIYTPEGRKIIGSATLHDDHIEADVLDPDVITKLTAGMTDHLSIGDKNRQAFEEDEAKGPIKRNVFDKEE